METHFNPGPSSNVSLMFICKRESELLTRYPRIYKLGKISLFYCRYAEYEVQGFWVKSFRYLENILRFSLKARCNTGNIFVQFNVALQVESWKALLAVLPPTSNIATQRKFFVASWNKFVENK